MAILKSEANPLRRVGPGFSRMVANLDNLMLVVCEFTNGPAEDPDPFHSHPHEQITYVEEGELFLFCGDEKHYLKKGDIYTIPSGLPHGIQVLSSKVRLIDCFTPLRDEFIEPGV
ncbi:MAG TPA: cupin domain-containing protein [Bacteroidales bacterium]|jgi:quercetin dioxygenase-like cupin family protein|nr:cupin domain-containing protein [Bacteroidales bacterium]HNR41879.1 cupin domain-containing protein [Bacteroidales bacterium]HQG78216.1 cupin domain-containing protein [Bacteroidales bacterium]